MVGPVFRAAVIEDGPAISALINRLAHHFLVDPGDHAGNAFFLSLITPEAIEGYISEGRIRYSLVEDAGGLVGTAAVLDGTHLYHLFVREDQQGSGLGRQLWEWAHREAGGGGFTVNASRNAVGFYERLGFVAAGDLVERDGLAFLPMRRP